MEIKEAKEKLRELEIDITDLCNKFYKETGLYITDLRLFESISGEIMKVGVDVAVKKYI